MTDSTRLSSGASLNKPPSVMMQIKKKALNTAWSSVFITFMFGLAAYFFISMQLGLLSRWNRPPQSSIVSVQGGALRELLFNEGRKYLLSANSSKSIFIDCDPPPHLNKCFSKIFKNNKVLYGQWKIAYYTDKSPDNIISNVVLSARYNNIDVISRGQQLSRLENSVVSFNKRTHKLVRADDDWSHVVRYFPLAGASLFIIIAAMQSFFKIQNLI